MVMKQTLLLLLQLALLPGSKAATTKPPTGFEYNNDVKCGYPFWEFMITEIACEDVVSGFAVDGEYPTTDETDTSGSYQYQSKYRYQSYQNQQYREYEEQMQEEEDEEGEWQREDGVCYFGDKMTVSGTLNLLEPMYRKMDVSIELCYYSNEWYWKSCKTYKTSNLNFGIPDEEEYDEYDWEAYKQAQEQQQQQQEQYEQYSEEQAEQQAQQQAEYYQQQYQNRYNYQYQQYQQYQQANQQYNLTQQSYQQYTPYDQYGYYRTYAEWQDLTGQAEYYGYWNGLSMPEEEYLVPGEHEWTTDLIIPTSKRTLKKGTIMTVNLIVKPKEQYSQFAYKQKNIYRNMGVDFSVHYTKCTATFNADIDREEYDQEVYERLCGVQGEEYQAEGEEGESAASGDEEGNGQNAYNQNWYNQKRYGYNYQNGYNQNGYNRNAYNQNGYNRNSYNQNGYNQNGNNRNGYNQNGNYQNAQDAYNQYLYNSYACKQYRKSTQYQNYQAANQAANQERQEGEEGENRQQGYYNYYRYNYAAAGVGVASLSSLGAYLYFGSKRRSITTISDESTNGIGASISDDYSGQVMI